MIMSDRGILATYRRLHGFGSHTFSFINAKSERYWVKFHFRSQQGVKNLTDAEAEAIVGKDRRATSAISIRASKRAISRNGRSKCRSWRKRTRPNYPTTVRSHQGVAA
jgi:Catalase